MIDLTIKTLDSRNHSFSVADDITVKQLKEQIAESVNVSAESQRLIYCGRVLQDDKKLSEYDVNGKVIHLVQRAPPAQGGSSDGNQNSSHGSGSHARSTPSIRHRVMRERRLMDGGNAMYLGAMAIPTDFMESQGLAISQPRHLLVQSRLSVARQMLNQASSILNDLEHPSASNEESSQQTSPTEGEGEAPPPEPNTTNSDVPMPGSIAVAAQVATAAAIAAAVSAAHTTSVQLPNLSTPDIQPLVVTVEGDEQGSVEAAGGATAAAEAAPAQTPAASQSAAAAAGDVDATISSTTADEAGRQQENQFSNDVLGGSRYPRLRPMAMARLMDTLASVNQRLQPFMERVHQTMREDPVLESPEETQRIFMRVSEVMHLLSHAYHALSDIMCDFTAPTPRFLRCRPVLIQHSAVLQTEIPIQAQINVRTNNSLLRQLQAQQNGGNQAAAGREGAAEGAGSNAGDTPTASTANGGPSVSSAASASASNSANTANVQTNTVGGGGLRGLRGGLEWFRGLDRAVAAAAAASASASALPTGVPGSGLAGSNSAATSDSASANASASSANQQQNRQTNSQGGARHINVMGPGNFEFFMDYSPGSITIDSLEATVVTNSNSNQPEVNVLGGIPWGNQSPNPGDIIQSLMQALTSQLVGAGVGQAASAANTPASSSAATTTAAASTAGGQQQQQQANATTANSQARGNTATHPTTSTQTRSTARPHVHFGPSMQGLGSSNFDPFLPCNSHHIARSRRRQQQRTPATAATPAASSSSSSSAAATTAAANSQSSAATASSASAAGRPTNGEGTAASSSAQPTTAAGQSPAAAAAAAGIRLPPSEVLMNLSLLVLENLNRQYAAAQPAAETPAAAGGAAAAAAPRNEPAAAGPTLRPIVEISSSSVPISQLIPLLAGGAPGGLLGPGNPLQNLLSASPSSTLASLLPEMTPDSVLVDLFITLAECLTFVDIANMAFGNQTMGLMRARPFLQQVVSNRLLRNEPLNEASASHAADVINQELRPHLEVILREANLREDIDLVATISQLNNRQLPRILSVIMTGANFQTAILIECYKYIRHICAIIQYCCIDGAQGMENIIRRIVENVASGVPGASSTIVSLWSFLASNSSMNDDIHRFIVYRRPDVQRPLTEQENESLEQPMEVEQENAPERVAELAASAPAAPPSQPPQPQPQAAVPTAQAPQVPQVEVADTLPDVIIGSESWHGSLPSDWVPIITRDSQRQRRQNSQPPFSDAYLSGMPSKRRKIITANKPQGSLSQVISENMQTAVNLAGVVAAPGVEPAAVAQSASGDSSLRLAYRDEVRASVRRSLQSHPDYTPDKYPNAAKYFDAK